MELIAMLVLLGIISIIRKHGEKLAEGYNKLVCVLIIVILIAAPFLVLLSIGIDGFSVDTLINSETTGPFTAILLFEVFVAIRILISKLFPRKKDKDHKPFWTQNENAPIMIMFLIISVISFFAIVMSDLPNFWLFMQMLFFIYFTIRGFI